MDLLQVLERRVEVLALERRRLGSAGDLARGLEVPDDVHVLTLLDDRVLQVVPALGEHLLDQADELRQRLVGRVDGLFGEVGPARLPRVQIEPWLGQLCLLSGGGR